MNEDRAGLHEPETADSFHLPSPSLWPAVLALGVALLLFGIVTSYIFSALGAAVLVWALAGWIGELRRE